MSTNSGGAAPTPPSLSVTRSMPDHAHAYDEHGTGRDIMRVGKYILLETIGEGAFGKVKLGIDEETGREYAIKMMRKSEIMAQDLIKQVRREITIMKNLDHPCVVNLYGVLTSSAHIYMVMDLISGGELFHLVSESGMLSENLARFYFQQLIDGIEYVHSKRIYHRDLKPENLLLSADKSTLKITDFGLSSIKELNPTSELCNTVMGSPHYIPPEIILPGAGVDNSGYDGAKVDIWACGMILYGMLAGCLPFDTDDDDHKYLYRKILHDDIRYPQHFSKEVTNLLAGLFVKNPDNRTTIEQIKEHAWFQLNYVPILPYGNHPGQSHSSHYNGSAVNVRRKSRKKRHSRKPNTERDKPRAKKVPQNTPAEQVEVEQVGENVIPDTSTRSQGELSSGNQASLRNPHSNSNLAQDVSAIDATVGTSTVGSPQADCNTAHNDNNDIDNESLRSRDNKNEVKDEREEARLHTNNHREDREHQTDQPTPSSTRSNLASIFSFFSPHRRKHSDAASYNNNTTETPSTPRREMKFLKKSLLTPRSGGRIKSDMWARTPTASSTTTSYSSSGVVSSRREDDTDGSKSLPAGQFDTHISGNGRNAGSWGSARTYNDTKTVCQLLDMHERKGNRSRNASNNVNNSSRTEIAEFGFETSSKTALSEALMHTSSTTNNRRRERARARSRSRQPGNGNGRSRQRSKSVVSRRDGEEHPRHQYVDDKAPASITNLGKYSYSRNYSNNSNSNSSSNRDGNGSSNRYSYRAAKNRDRIIVLESPPKSSGSKNNDSDGDSRLKTAQTAPVKSTTPDYTVPTRTDTTISVRKLNANSYNYNTRGRIETHGTTAREAKKEKVSSANGNENDNINVKNDALIASYVINNNMIDIAPTEGAIENIIDPIDDPIISVALPQVPDNVMQQPEYYPEKMTKQHMKDVDTTSISMSTNVARVKRMSTKMEMTIAPPLLTMTKENPQMDNLPSPSAVNYEQRNRSNVFKKCNITLDGNGGNVSPTSYRTGRFVLTTPPDPLCPWLDTEDADEFPEWAIDRCDIFMDIDTQDITAATEKIIKPTEKKKEQKKSKIFGVPAPIFSQLNSTFIRKLKSLESTEIQLEKEKL